MSTSYAVVVPNRIGSGWVGARSVSGSRSVSASRSVPAQRPTAQVYARRRLIAFLTLVTIVAALWVGTGSVLANRGSVPASTPAVRPAVAAAPLAAAAAPAAQYIVQPGDTLWSIGERLRGEHSLADYVASLVDANGGASVSVGQVLVLP